MFVKQLLPMMKLSKSIHYMEYELMIRNLWGTWHHYQPPLHYLLLSSLLWCPDAPSSWSNDDWHVSEASTPDHCDFLYFLAYLKHILFLASIRTKHEMSQIVDSAAYLFLLWLNLCSNHWICIGVVVGLSMAWVYHLADFELETYKDFSDSQCI
jgi:hypothetical protein